MTRQELWEALLSGQSVTFRHTMPGNTPLDSPVTTTTVGRILSIAAEDGSGYSFNVNVSLPKSHGYGTRMIYVKCDRPTLSHENYRGHYPTRPPVKERRA